MSLHRSPAVPAKNVAQAGNMSIVVDRRIFRLPSGPRRRPARR